MPVCVARPGPETTSVDCIAEFVASTGSVTNLFDGSGVGVGVGVGSGVGVGVAVVAIVVAFVE